MNCPKCGNQLRNSKKSEDYMLCDVCKKKYFLEDLEYEMAKPVKKKSHGCLISVIIAVGILIALFLLVGILFSGSDDPQKVADIEGSNNVNESQNDEGNPTEERTSFNMGELIDYGDMEIVLTNYSENSGNEWTKPNEGNTFVFIEFEISNNSDADKTISSMLSFETYCDDYLLEYSGNALMALSLNKDAQGLDGTIVPGKKMKGTLALEVPENWDEIEVYFVDSLWTDRKLSFVINNN